MNKIISALLLLLMSCPLMAADRSGILFTSQLVEQAKHKIKNDTTYARCWSDIQKVADAKVKSNDLKSLDHIALAYMVTGDGKYADAAKRMLLALDKVETWGSNEMLVRKPTWTADLGLASKCYNTAMAYDAIYNVLSSTERKSIAQTLYRLGVKPSIDDWASEPYRIHSLNSMGHNWWTSCVGMGGILALALRNELPQAGKDAEAVMAAMPQWFGFEGDVLQNKPRTFDRAGGMYESMNYANFGITEALMFLAAWHNVYHSKRMPYIPQLKNITDFFVHLCYPNSTELNTVMFGDGNKHVTAENSLMLLWYLGYHDKNILWYISQVHEGQHREGFFRNRPMGLLYYPSLNNAPKLPDTVPSRLWSDFGWAAMRDSWKPDATLLAVKSGYTWNHSHADANSFHLYHHGVDIIEDPANSHYGSPEYRGYFFQSEAHNVVLFNGKGQPRFQQYHGAPLRGYLHYLMDAGRMKYLLADGTGPMSEWLNRNFRHFLWIDKAIYIIDDLHSHEPGNWQWLWHFNGEMTKRTYDINVTNGSSSIAVRPLFPRMLAASNFLHDYPDDLYMEEHEAPTKTLKETTKYYSIHMPGETDKVKAITAILLKDSPDDKDLPQIERREGKEWIGLRIKWRGKVTDLYVNQVADGTLMHSNSWIEADGWTTDAYMLAVSYKEGTNPALAKDVFICYGSALRRGTDSYFSSLTKLFLMRQDGKVMVEGASNPIYQLNK